MAGKHTWREDAPGRPVTLLDPSCRGVRCGSLSCVFVFSSFLTCYCILQLTRDNCVPWMQLGVMELFVAGIKSQGQTWFGLFFPLFLSMDYFGNAWAILTWQLFYQ